MEQRTDIVYDQPYEEYGDVAVDEEGDVIGKSKRVKNTKQSIQRLAAKQSRLVRPRDRNANPNDARIAKIADFRAATRRPEIRYISCKGAKIVSASIGPDAVLRDAEKDAVRAAIFDATPFNQQVFAFTAGVCAVEQVLSTTHTTPGPLANNAVFRYAGSILTLSASVLNATPGAPVTATIQLSGTFTLQYLFRIQEGVKAVEITVLHAVMANGEPRFFAPLITVDNTGASGNFNYTLSGLPPDYNPTLLTLQPGDGSVDKLLSLMDV